MVRWGPNGPEAVLVGGEEDVHPVLPEVVVAAEAEEEEHDEGDPEHVHSDADQPEVEVKVRVPWCAAPREEREGGGHGARAMGQKAGGAEQGVRATGQW